MPGEPKPPMLSWIDGFLTDFEPGERQGDAYFPDYTGAEVVRAVRWLRDHIDAQQATIETLNDEIGRLRSHVADVVEERDEAQARLATLIETVREEAGNLDRKGHDASARWIQQACDKAATEGRA